MSARRSSKGGYDGKIAGLYDLEDTIGTGHFAVVKLARHVFTGEKVAVKVIDKTKLDEVSRAHLFQEVRCMKLVQHPNVVRLYEVIDTHTKLYLILELGDGGDMYDYIMKHEQGLDEENARKYFKQIVDAISYCHELHVVHRDLKPENVVFFEKLGIVKLTDFGFSNMFNPGKKLETSCGSLAYSAPEILLGDSYDPPAVDVWSLGVILYMLVCGTPPFQEANDSETLTMIMDCKYHVPPDVSKECQILISKMLIRDPSQRASLEDIIMDPWLESMTSSTCVMLPLISRKHLSDDDHNIVIQRMVDGTIATKEEILMSLEKDAYDHVAATYYLLAERRLRKQQQDGNYLANSNRRPSAIGAKPHLEPLALSPRIQPKSGSSTEPSFVQSLVSPPGTHPAPISSNSSSTIDRAPSPKRSSYVVRKYSLIQEESIDEDDEMDIDLDESRSVRSLESLDDLPPRKLSGTDLSIFTENNGTNFTGRFPLHPVASSPQLLNQINEEGESDEAADVVPSKISSGRMLHGRSSITSPDMGQKYDRKKRRGHMQRGTSCSSSDASDTDDTEGRSRKDHKLKHKMVHRRDSSDHSSDTDNQSGPGPGSAGTDGGGSKVKQNGANGSGGSGGGGGGGSGGSGGGESGKTKSGGDSGNQKQTDQTEILVANSGGGGGGVDEGNKENSNCVLVNENIVSNSEATPIIHVRSEKISIEKPATVVTSVCSTVASTTNDRIANTTSCTTLPSIVSASQKTSQDYLLQNGRSHKTSDVSVASTLSSLSLSSIASKNSLKYIVDDRRISNTRIIEVQARNTSDFSLPSSIKEDLISVCSDDCVLNKSKQHLRRGKRGGSRVKTDINSNGLQPGMYKGSAEPENQVATVKVETNCCSLI